MANVNNWFEIPISSIERTFKFYSEVLGGELKTMLDANFITSTHRYWPGSEPEPLDFTYLSTLV